MTGSAHAGDVRPAGVSDLPSGGYTPAMIAKAYGYDRVWSLGGTGTNRTIALVVAFGCPTLQSDLDYFCSDLGIPRITPTIAYPAGSPSMVDSGWAGETMMDVEWAHAMAPDARILVVVSRDDSDANLNACIRYASSNADLVSMSWGGVEDPSDPSNRDLFTSPSVTYVAASGDNGSEVDWPGSDTNVLSVGGTSVVFSASNTVISETAWSDSSGGVSRYQRFPSYQAGWSASSGGRNVPDVSMLADPYTGIDVYNTDPTTGVAGWSVNGGTSAATPMWSALLACRASLGNSWAGAFQKFLYPAAALSFHGTGTKIPDPSLLRDVTKRQPSNPDEPYAAYPPTAGFDLVTGLGSPLAATVATLAPGVTSPVVITFPALPQVTFGSTNVFSLHATASRGLPVSYASSKTNVASVSGGLVTIHGAGTTTITATVSGVTVTPVTNTLVVSKGLPVLSMTLPFSVPFVANGKIPLKALSTPSLPVIFSSSSNSILSISGTNAQMHGKGTAVITASVVATANYTAASTSRSITVH